MYPELGHRPLNRLSVSNRAYFLEKSVPYLASALSAGVVGLGPLLASMPSGNYLRKRKVGNVSWTEVNPSGNMVPTAPPISTVSSISGDTHTILDSTAPGKNQVVTVVGSDTDRNYSCKVYLGRTSGWRFKPSVYRRSKLFNNTLTILAGDVFTTNIASTDVPAYITGDVYTAQGSGFMRNYETTATTVQKINAQNLSVMNIKSKFNNLSSHFCFPLGTFNLYGDNSVGSFRIRPLGLQDIFADQTNLTTLELQRYNESLQMGLQNTYDQSGVKFYGAPTSSLTISKDTGLYVSMEMEFTIQNHKDYSQTFELYYMTPRKDTQKSPLYDYCYTHATSDENIIGNNAHPNPLAVDKSLFRLKAFRDLWKCISKKTIKLAGLASAKVVIRIPLSLVEFNKLFTIANGDGNCSFANLTGWFYVKAYGLFGLDFEGTTGGVSNAQMMSYGPADFVIQCHQKVTLLNQCKRHRPVIDMRSTIFESVATTTTKENDENNTADD